MDRDIVINRNTHAIYGGRVKQVDGKYYHVYYHLDPDQSNSPNSLPPHDPISIDTTTARDHDPPWPEEESRRKLRANIKEKAEARRKWREQIEQSMTLGGSAETPSKKRKLSTSESSTTDFSMQADNPSPSIASTDVDAPFTTTSSNAQASASPADRQTGAH